MAAEDDSHDNTPLESTGKLKGTIEYALRPYRIPMDVLREEHGAVLGMVTKLLGEPHRNVVFALLLLSWFVPFAYRAAIWVCCIIVSSLIISSDEGLWGRKGFGRKPPNLRKLAALLPVCLYTDINRLLYYLGAYGTGYGIWRSRGEGSIPSPQAYLLG